MWELLRDGIALPVRFSVPAFPSEDAAMAAGAEARVTHLSRLAKRWPSKPTP
jgi:hypothetical protein